MADGGTTVLVVATFLLAGLIKGVVGLGFPTITVGLLVTPLGLQSAIAITVVPAIVTNVVQAFTGGRLRRLLARLWPLLACAVAGVLAGTAVLAGGERPALVLALGLLLVLYALVGLLARAPPPPGRWERPLTPTVGAVSGLIAGMTGSFTLPGVPYLQSLGLERDALVQALGLVFLTLSLSLAVGLGRTAILADQTLALSALAVAPSLIGMEIGRRVRRRLPEARFRRLLYLALMALGTYIAVAALL